MSERQGQGKPAPEQHPQLPLLPAPLLPEVRLFNAGDTSRLCTCGASAQLPDCHASCDNALTFTAAREQRLLLCRCGRSQKLPFCDGSHNPPAPSWRAKWRRFWAGL